jgi:transposase
VYNHNLPQWNTSELPIEPGYSRFKEPAQPIVEMFTLSTSHRFHLYSQPTDMRKSFDGLSGLIQNILGSNPLSGDVFIFINRRRDKIKLLHWQGISFTLYYKRLEEGTFEVPSYDPEVGSIVLSYAQMVMLVDGLTIKNIEKRKSYNPNF